jgi:hypothetical protein
MHRLLVISCSQRKSLDKGLVPAVDRYDGPAFRVLRKYLREATDPALRILILSAKFGLVDAERKIPYYDLRLTRHEAKALRPRVSERMRQAIGSGRWAAVGVCASSAYRIALGDISEIVPMSVRLDLIGGGLGLRLTRLKDWLRGSMPGEPTSLEDGVARRSDRQVGTPGGTSHKGGQS